MLLPLVIFTDSIPTVYEHTMDGALGAGSETTYDFWPALHDMFGDLTADSTPLVLSEQIELPDIAAGLGSGTTYTFAWPLLVEHDAFLQLTVDASATVEIVNEYMAGDLGLDLNATIEFLGTNYGAADATLPSGYTLAATATVGNGGIVNATLPAPYLVSGTAIQRNLASSAASLPDGWLVSGAAKVGPYNAFLPDGYTLSATGYVWIVAAPTVAMPGGYALSAATTITNIGTCNASLPGPLQLAAQVKRTTYGIANATLPGGMLLAATVVVSNRGQSNASLPGGYTLQVVSGNAIPASADATLPWAMYANVTQAVSLTLSRVATLTAATAAVTEYEGFAFNSMATFNGRTFLAGPSGISEFTGGADGATAIAARARTGVLELGTPALKRPRKAWIVGRSAGHMRVSIIAEGNQYDYQVEPFGDDTRAHRTALGRGLKHNFLQFEIANEDGADFDLEALRAEIDGVIARANASAS